MTKQKKILIIGGMGCVGRIIATELVRRYYDASIIVASRTAPTVEVDGTIFQSLDVRNISALRAALSSVDLVIIAAGPFDELRSSIHKSCIDAKVDVIDINDSTLAAAEIIDLKHAAKTENVRVLTGMGLAPGLSSLLIFKLAQEMQEMHDKNRHFRVRLYMGARNSGGPSNASVLFNSFQLRLPTISGGRSEIKPVKWSGSESKYQFPGNKIPLKLLPFSSPECVTLPTFASTRALGIASLDWRYHIQFLPPSVGRFLAHVRITKFRRVMKYLSQYFYQFGNKMKKRHDADETTTLIVETKDGENGYAIHGTVATSHLTAMMAVAVAIFLLDDGKNLEAGVYPLERLLAKNPTAESSICRWLKKRGVIITKDRRPKTATDFRTIFGDSTTFDGTVASLRNYGHYWYSVGKIPPKIKRYQRQCLLRSRLWKEVCDRTSWYMRIMLMARIRRQQKTFQRHIARRLFELRGGTSVSAEIIGDFSLFAAGYSEARNLLGDAALPLYSDMFLESSAMEMAWLWPSPCVFAASDNAIATVSEYLKAYIETTHRAGVMKATFKQYDASFEIRFEQCIYAQILQILGCPELGGLVREMEVRAISEIAERCGFVTKWQQGDAAGVGCLIVSAPQSIIHDKIEMTEVAE